jgi:DNA-binding transcriptional regulator LsrR (DeoR family)
MHLHTKKQQQYFKEVIRLHYEKGYGEDRISRILPIGHSTVSRWIAIFAAENATKSVQMAKTKFKLPTQPTVIATAVNDVKAFQMEVARLQTQLKHEKLRADAYDEMINVAESKFKVAIRKKAGAKR